MVTYSVSHIENSKSQERDIITHYHNYLLVSMSCWVLKDINFLWFFLFSMC